MSSMIGAIRRALTRRPPQEHVHFHVAHDGRVFVCDVASCSSARLALHDLSAR